MVAGSWGFSKREVERKREAGPCAAPFLSEPGCQHPHSIVPVCPFLFIVATAPIGKGSSRKGNAMILEEKGCFRDTVLPTTIYR